MSRLKELSPDEMTTEQRGVYDDICNGPRGRFLAPFQGLLRSPAIGGRMQEITWDGELVWEHLDPGQHHDARRLPNGNTLYLGWEKMPADAARRVVGGVAGSEDEGGAIHSDYLREVTPAGVTVWEWHAWEHMEIEKYPLHPLCPRRVLAWCNSTHPMRVQQPGGSGRKRSCYRQSSRKRSC